MPKSKVKLARSSLHKALEAFASEHSVNEKGFLCVGLLITRAAKSMTFPISAKEFMAESHGQVRGLGKGAVQRVLSDYGISRVLAEEGGRTSRGSIRNMQDYVAFLNKAAVRKDFNLDDAEAWWIERVRRFFTGKPFRMRVDPARSLRVAVRDILEQAERRQREQSGTMLVGAIMQHLVGAKLEIALNVALEQHGFSVADAPSARAGDFLIGDVAIHVTRTPTEALIRKCVANLEAGYRCLIVTTQKGAVSAESLAEPQGVGDRIDLFEFEQFLATNIYELSKFEQKGRKVTVKELVERYNKIVAENETDPSLMIALA